VGGAEVGGGGDELGAVDDEDATLGAVKHGLEGYADGLMAGDMFSLVLLVGRRGIYILLGCLSWLWGKILTVAGVANLGCW